MLSDRRKFVENKAMEARRQIEIVGNYGAFLKSRFEVGDWFATLTFRDAHQDLQAGIRMSTFDGKHRSGAETRSDCRPPVTVLAPDPRLDSWKPDSRNSVEPGPPVKDAAMREMHHWLFELGWEAAGRSMVGLFEVLTAEMNSNDKEAYARHFSKKCVCCALLNNRRCAHHYEEMRSVAIQQISWVIAEEFGRVGGRWHVHLLIRGVKHLRREDWWEKAFERFGRCRIEPIHA